MPLPADERTVEVGKDLLKTLQGIFGPHPGFRPAHAKGVLLTGTFTPTPQAATLSRAQHFTSACTPVIARFSSSTGLPQLPDTDPNGNPRGLAVRFKLAESPRRVHTDIVAHSVNGFPARDGPSALEFFRAVADGSIGAYLPTHPAALAFVQAPKPFPAGFGREAYFALHAYRLVDSQGKGTYVRYRWVPSAGVSHLTEEEVKGKAAGYLFDELPALIRARGPIAFKLVAQVAAEGDVTDDVTVQWPEEGREMVELGLMSLDGLLQGEGEDAKEQKSIIFDPVPRVDGVEPSDDPLIDVRAGLYLISGRERRAA